WATPAWRWLALLWPPRLSSDGNGHGANPFWEPLLSKRQRTGSSEHEALIPNDLWEASEPNLPQATHQGTARSMLDEQLEDHEHAGKRSGNGGEYRAHRPALLPEEGHDAGEERTDASQKRPDTKCGEDPISDNAISIEFEDAERERHRQQNECQCRAEL